MSILGAVGQILGSGAQYVAAQKNIKLQKQFAKTGIQWKVADAKKAGIHPLYALGANTTSFAPVSIGDPASSLGAAGQDIGRAIEAGGTAQQRVSNYQEAMNKLQLRHMSLQNDLLASQIARYNQAGQPPGMPTGRGGGTQAPQYTPYLTTPDGTVLSSTRASDAQAAQDRFGELFEQLYGGQNWYLERGRRALMTYDHRRTTERVVDELLKLLRGRE